MMPNENISLSHGEPDKFDRSQVNILCLFLFGTLFLNEFAEFFHHKNNVNFFYDSGVLLEK